MKRPSTWLPFALILMLVACKPTEGSSCDKGEARCVDGTTELVCQGGKFIATPCRGPGGCVQTENDVTCDISKNQEGDACSTDEEGVATCLSEKKILVCVGGKYAAVNCRGPDGCLKREGRAVCDTSVAERGDACRQNGQKACTPNGKELLLCEGLKYTLMNYCRGKEGCVSTGKKLDCDMSLAELGDPCHASMEGKNACDEKANSIAVCKTGKFVEDEKCEKGKKCISEGGSIKCDKE